MDMMSFMKCVGINADNHDNRPRYRLVCIYSSTRSKTSCRSKGKRRSRNKNLQTCEKEKALNICVDIDIIMLTHANQAERLLQTLKGMIAELWEYNNR